MKKSIALVLTLILLLPIFTEGETFFAKSFSGFENNDSSIKIIETPLLESDNNYFIPVNYANNFNKIYFSETANVEYKVKSNVRPPLSPLRISGEIIGGTALGIGGGGVCAFFGWLYGALLGPDEPSEGYFTKADKYAEIGFLIGWPLMTAGAIDFIGNIGDETGTFFGTIGGTVLGGVLGIVLVNSIKDEDKLSGSDWHLISIPFLSSAICGTVVFNLTRRYKTPTENKTGLINFENNQINLSIPTIHLKRDPFDEKKLCKKIELLTMRF